MAITAETLKQTACAVIDDNAHALNDVSQALWREPELQFKEHKAHVFLTDWLEKKGFQVERHYLLETGFRASFTGNTPGPRVAVLCEYDALPDIGHACGHNLIAEAGVGAAIGIKAAMEQANKAGQNIGELIVLGTPAEEGGGGKIKMIDKGAFKDTDVAMMCHPTPVTDLESTMVYNSQVVNVTYHGKASHAAAFPWEGVNALDAAVLAYNNISVLRQQMKPRWRVHGVITNGGAKPNIIPEISSLEFSVRAPTKKEHSVLKDKFEKCLQGAALATGCTVDIKWTDFMYQNIITNSSLMKAYKKNAVQAGMPVPMETKVPIQASTDMGNVSYVVPSIHPWYAVDTDARNHMREFTDHVGKPAAQPSTLIQAKTMAMTAIDVLCNDGLLQQIKEDFATDMKNLED